MDFVIYFAERVRIEMTASKDDREALAMTMGYRKAEFRSLSTHSIL